MTCHTGLFCQEAIIVRGCCVKDVTHRPEFILLEAGAKNAGKLGVIPAQGEGDDLVLGSNFTDLGRLSVLALSHEVGDRCS